MKQPLIPDNELIRLDTLRSLNILDTPAEERFDRLTRLAKRMFGVPMALVSLIDENRQWFKSCNGFDASQTARDISFCGHAILGEEIFLVPDAAADERFSDNPLVTQFPHIRFYAGCPLKHPNGAKLGTLCILDIRPRSLNRDDLIDLRYLAEMAERELAQANLATTDELTGLSNRRGFLLLAQKSLSFCMRQNTHCALVYFDLDNFNEINTTYGEKEGDKVLKLFSEKLKANFRDSDVMARLGGDEFALLLNNSTSMLAEAVVCKFEEALREFNTFSRLRYRLTFARSIVTAYLHAGTNVETMLKDAESLMQDSRRRMLIRKGLLH